MKRLSKRLKKSLEGIEKDKLYSLEEAVSILKHAPHPKFDETVELACRVNIDPKQSEQVLRGTVVLPHGIGKTVRIVVFCKGEDVNKAKTAGADFAGSSEIIDKIKNGWLEFDKAASTPEMMKDVAQLGKILGPRGMMPSPKTGSVGEDIGHIVQELKSGKVQFRADKTGNIHSVAGKISFPEGDICENLSTLIKAILVNRPAQVKGRYIKTLSVTTSMGPSVKLDLSKLDTSK